MESLTVFCLLLFTRRVLADDLPSIVDKPCDSTDSECLVKSVTQFFDNTWRGIPQLNVKPVDPLIIPSYDINFDDNIRFSYKNLNVTGLRKQKVKSFTVDVDTAFVQVEPELNMNIAGDIVINSTEKSKTFAGSFTSQAKVLVTASYNYEVLKDDKGVDHFEALAETISCKVLTTPEIQWNPELLQTLTNDDDFKKVSEETKQKLRDKSFCKIVEESYKYVVQNVRTLVRFIPLSALLTKW